MPGQSQLKHRVSVAARRYICRIPAADCPSNTTPPPLEISLSWDVDADLDLYVVEPGGVEVNNENTLGVSLSASNIFQRVRVLCCALPNVVCMLESLCQMTVYNDGPGFGSDAILFKSSFPVFVFCAIPTLFHEGVTVPGPRKVSKRCGPNRSRC